LLRGLVDGAERAGAELLLDRVALDEVRVELELDEAPGADQTAVRVLAVLAALDLGRGDLLVAVRAVRNGRRRCPVGEEHLGRGRKGSRRQWGARRDRAR